MNSIKASNQSNRFKYGCSASIVIFCLFSVAIFYWQNYEARYTGLDVEHAYDVARIFSLSLKANDSRRAKSIVTEKKWPELIEWISNHNTVDCDLDFDGENGGVYASEIFDNDKQAHYDVYIAYYCTSSTNILAIRSVELNYTSEGWKIMDWGNICEAFTIDNSCLDFLDH